MFVCVYDPSLMGVAVCLQDVEREASRLDQAAVKLRLDVADLADQNLALRPLVDNATEHANNLKARVNSLIG